VNKDSEVVMDPTKLVSAVNAIALAIGILYNFGYFLEPGLSAHPHARQSSFGPSSGILAFKPSKLRPECMRDLLLYASGTLGLALAFVHALLGEALLCARARVGRSLSLSSSFDVFIIV
jgi:hypothetical protein